MEPLSDHSTPAKPLGVHDKYGLNTFKSENQLRLIRSFQTPPSRLGKIRNPFESIIHEKLHTHFSSPSVFMKVQPTTPEEKFKWTIDELSHLNPADIDDQVDQFATLEHDSALESVAQSRIDNYFSLTEIIPSPFANHIMQSPLIKEHTHTSNTPESKVQKSQTDSSAQTVLSLPPQLPEELEAILRPYFTHTQNQQESISPTSHLYKQLFSCDEAEKSPDTSPAKSINLNLSPIQFSPCGSGNGINNCTIDSSSPDDELKDCLLSPISSGSRKTGPESRVMRHESNHHMSVDVSFNVPDMADLPCNTSNGLDSSKSPQRETLSNSLVHWDMEYKHFTSRSENCSVNEMDVSTSNTPKSKKCMGQRKKLSDSFGDDSNFEGKRENAMLPIETDVKSNVTDAGYHTGILSTEESWSRTHLIASTPTKQMLFN